MKAIIGWIDVVVEKQALASSLLMIVLVLLVSCEVVLRYFFNAPTTWSLELTTFIFGVHFVMGYGYTESFDGHVRVDILSSRLPRKVQNLVHIVLTACITLPVVAMLGIWAWDSAMTSTRIFEKLSSAWAPPIWPVKIFMALGFTFLFLQVLSNLIKRIQQFSHGQAEA